MNLTAVLISFRPLSRLFILLYNFHAIYADTNPPPNRRREIENVMKKARASPNSNAYWDKKLLEVEAKDPNR